MNRYSILTQVRNRLYASSAGRCNKCETSLFTDKGCIGEIAHIVAYSKDGPRGTLTNGDVNSYENLILLCRNCHKTVDDNPNMYTVEVLTSMKNDFVNKIKHSTNFQQNKDLEFLSLYFLNTPFSGLLKMVRYAPYEFSLDIGVFEEMAKELYIDCPTYFPLDDSILDKYFENFIYSFRNLNQALSPFSTTNDERYVLFNLSSNERTMVLNTELPQREEIASEIRLATEELVENYNTLRQYIASTYPNVCMNIYNETL